MSTKIYFDIGKNLKDLKFDMTALKDPKYLEIKKWMDGEISKMVEQDYKITLYNYAYDNIIAKPGVLTKTAMQDAINTTDKFAASYPTTAKEAINILKLFCDMKFPGPEAKLGQPFITEIKKSLSIVLSTKIYGKTLEKWINGDQYGNEKLDTISKTAAALGISAEKATQDGQPFGVAVSTVDNSIPTNIPVEECGPYKLGVLKEPAELMFCWGPLRPATWLGELLEGYGRPRTDYEECRIKFTEFYKNNNVVPGNLFEYWQSIIGMWQLQCKDESTLEWVFVRLKDTKLLIEDDHNKTCGLPLVPHEILHELLGDNNISI